MARPFLGHSLKNISNIVSACLIMHNMCVSDRVMDGDVYVGGYNPVNTSLTMDEETIENENSKAGMPARGDRLIGLATSVGDANVVQNVLGGSTKSLARGQ
jgi:hypothetical protein